MRNLVRSEWRKLTTTRMWLGLTLGGLVLVSINVVAIGLTAGNANTGNTIRKLSDPASVRLVYGAPLQIGYLMPLLLGVILIAGEFRHQTITPTFLAMPRRGRVLVAKMMTGGVAGLLMGALYTTLAAGLGAVIIAGRHYPVLLTSNGVPRLLALMVIGLGVWTVFGVGFGALFRNQVAAILVAVGLAQLVEPLLSLTLRWAHLRGVAKFLPSNASNAMIQAAADRSTQLLPWWGGALTLLAWGALTALLGSLLTLRRDIT